MGNIDAITQFTSIGDICGSFGGSSSNVGTDVDIADVSRLNIIFGKTLFNSDAYTDAALNGLKTFVVENFDNTDGLDLTDTATSELVVEYYDNYDMCFNFEGSANNIADCTIKTNDITVPETPMYMWVLVESTGVGTVDIQVISNNKTINLENGKMVYVPLLSRSKTFYANISLHGDVKLKNIAWGVK